MALSRLPWLQNQALVPFAALQQRAAEAVTGTAGRIVVDTSCTGADAMALSIGAILAFPAPWRRRLIGALAALGLLTLANTARIGQLSLVARDRPVFDLFHVYLWPAALMLIAAGFVFAWMRRQESGSPSDGPRTGRGLLPARRGTRLLWASCLAVALYYAAAPALGKSPWLFEVARWVALSTVALAGSLGLEAQVQGNYLTAESGRWIVTQACVLTPLIAIWIAGVTVLAGSHRRRWLGLLATLPLFFILGIARLFVLTLPAGLLPAHGVAMHAFYQLLIGLLLLLLAVRSTADGRRHGLSRFARVLGAAGLGAAAATVVQWITAATAEAIPDLAHLGHGYSDPQGALALLPAFQIGLWAGLWQALGRPGGRRRLALGVLALGVLQVLAVVSLGELAAHFSLELPIVAIRALAVAAPLALAWTPQGWRRRVRVLPSVSAAAP